MGQTAPSCHAPAPTVVRRPRASDAIGTALRDAYLRDAVLPEDMRGLLKSLNDNQTKFN